MSTMATRPMHTTVDDKSAYFRLLLSYSPALTLRTVLESYRGARLALDLLRQKAPLSVVERFHHAAWVGELHQHVLSRKAVHSSNTYRTVWRSSRAAFPAYIGESARCKKVQR